MRTARVIATAEGTRREAFGPTEWALLAAIAAMWGSSFLWIGIGLESFEPGVVALLRLALGAAALGLAPRSRTPIARSDWPRLALLGLVWMAAPLVLFPLAQDLGVTSALNGMINGAMPLFAALVAAILLRRMPGPAQLAGLVIGFAGIVLIAVPSAGETAGTTVGIGMALFATILYGLAANIAVPLQQRYGALPVVFRAQLVAVVLVAPFGLAQFPGSSFSWPSLLAMVVLGLFGTGLAFIAMAVLVGRAGATRGAVAIYFIPVVALLLGVTLRDETVPLISVLGVGLVLAGAWLTSRRETRRADQDGTS
ncbi:MAG TPA: DMT family transporter [Actinomycetota bacterium]|nr:DMT family transporter [Actinomycetota bacterium]